LNAANRLLVGGWRLSFVIFGARRHQWSRIFILKILIKASAVGMISEFLISSN
jgi:hypothetical protein